jgi:hypothetical protein
MNIPDIYSAYDPAHDGRCPTHHYTPPVPARGIAAIAGDDVIGDGSCIYLSYCPGGHHEAWV